MPGCYCRRTVQERVYGIFSNQISGNRQDYLHRELSWKGSPLHSQPREMRAWYSQLNHGDNRMKYMQPRPSSIVAALYTARDLEVDVAILHGPSGCSFKHARLLEEDGLRVLTTSLADNEFIFGGHDPLVTALQYAEREFSPDRMAVVGTCVSMIIGEDLLSAVDDSGITTPTIAVDIHAGYPENIDGVIATLVPAAEAGWISPEELDRQKYVLAKANEVERLRGAASQSYIEPSRGDLKHKVAVDLLRRIKKGERGVAVMNAKKETAYMFADELIALHEVCPGCGYQLHRQPRRTRTSQGTA